MKKNYILTLLVLASFLGGYFYKSGDVQTFSLSSSDKITAHEVSDLLDNLLITINSISSETKKETCKKIANDVYSKLFNVSSIERNSSLKAFSENELKELTEKSFNVRLQILDKIRELNAKDKNKLFSCFSKTRSVVRALRYFEDHLIEKYENLKGNTKSYSTFSQEGSGEPYFLVNKKFRFTGVESLQDGDVIISRGKAYASAAIARMGLDDTQFSHLSFVHKKDEKLYTTEAHIEIGSVVAEISKHIEQKNSRSLVLRFKPNTQGEAEKVIKKASAKIFNEVEYSQKSKVNVPYDFGMDLEDGGKKMFCSETLYRGLKMVGSITVPSYPTKFSPKLIPFLKQIGIEVNKNNIKNFKAFFPGDLQYDPNFEVVAEWRNPSFTRESRQHDVVLSVIFEKMEGKDSFHLHGSFLQKFKAFSAKALRKAGFLKDKVSGDMNIEQLEAFITLEVVGKVLQEQVSKNKNASFKEMREALRKYFNTDKYTQDLEQLFSELELKTLKKKSQFWEVLAELRMK